MKVLRDAFAADAGSACSDGRDREDGRLDLYVSRFGEPNLLFRKDRRAAARFFRKLLTGQSREPRRLTSSHRHWIAFKKAVGAC